jgi:hypothetical protein
MKKLLALNLLLLVFASFAVAADFDAYVFWVPYGTQKTVEWNPIKDASGYEIYAWQMEGEKRFLAGKIVTIPEVSVVWRTHGHYVLYVRAFKDVGGVRNFGAWGHSLDPAVGIVKGAPRAWALYVPR